MATAGHVDHGKSTLVRALTGMEPDRFAEERRRGMTIDLGYAWTTLPSGAHLAFVDVPGHQRFIANMLTGLGPVPAALFVVAADEGWSRQSEEHLAALEALRVRHVVLAVTRSDRADPGPALHDATARLQAVGLADGGAVVVSGFTGTGLDDLRRALDRMLVNTPVPDITTPARFWIDRAFAVRGAGLVVTGTLSSGRITTGDRLSLRSRNVIVRGIHSYGLPRTEARPVSRVALNLRGADPAHVRRGDVLLAPDRFHLATVVDVRIETRDRLPDELVLHVGTAAVPVRVRPLGASTARLTLSRAAPLRAGDRAVLRDPGRQSVAAGVLVLDADPPALRRRGAARLRAAELAVATVPPDPAVEIGRRGVVARAHLDRLGVNTTAYLDHDGWLIAPDRRRAWVEQVPDAVARWAYEHPLDPDMPTAALARALKIPAAVLGDLVVAAGLHAAGGRVRSPTRPPGLGAAEAGLTVLLDRLAITPFAAPEHDDLLVLGLGRREIAAAVRVGRLIEIADGVVLGPDALSRATRVLAGLEQPFTLSAARQALGTTRRVAVPLLERLDVEGVTERVDTVTRRVVSTGE